MAASTSSRKGFFFCSFLLTFCALCARGKSKCHESRWLFIQKLQLHNTENTKTATYLDLSERFSVRLFAVAFWVKWQMSPLELSLYTHSNCFLSLQHVPPLWHETFLLSLFLSLGMPRLCWSTFSKRSQRLTSHRVHNCRCRYLSSKAQWHRNCCRTSCMNVKLFCNDFQVKSGLRLKRNLDHGWKVFFAWVSLKFEEELLREKNSERRFIHE